MHVIKRIFPFLNWFPVTGAEVRADMVAGTTVALLLIPQAMAYADLAGLPPEVGLYASFLPVILGALFGSCRQLASGPVAMTSILTAGLLGAGAVTGRHDYLQLALLLALLVGIIRIFMGLFRLAALVNMLSHPVMGGFTNAAAMIIGLSQLGKILGVNRTESRVFGGFIYDTADMLIHVHKTHLPTLAMGTGTLLLILFLKRRFPRLPAMLIAMILSIIVSRLIGYDTHWHGKVVGEIPPGLPGLSLDFGSGADLGATLNVVKTLLPGAFALVLIGFMEVVSVSKSIALKTHQRIDLNQELIGQGIASLGSAVTHGYPVSGSFSRSAMTLTCGGRTGLSAVFSGLIVMLALLFFTPYLYHLPKAVLAACIMMAVAQLMNLRVVQRSWQVNRNDGLTALATWVSTLAFAPAIERGILVGVAMSMFFYLRRTMSPPLVVVGVSPDGTFQDASLLGLNVDEHLPAVRFDGSLYFGSVEAFEESVIDALRKFPQAKALLVICEGINFVDASGEWCLRQLWQKLREQKVEIYFTGLKHQPFSVLESSGLVDEIGRSHFVGSVRIAALAVS